MLQKELGNTNSSAYLNINNMALPCAESCENRKGLCYVTVILTSNIVATAVSKGDFPGCSDE